MSDQSIREEGCEIIFIQISKSEMSWKEAQSSGQAGGSDIRVLVQELLERPKKLRKLVKMRFSKVLINLISMSEKFDSLKSL